jgi:ribose-phosphate pyrophosphokinase
MQRIEESPLQELVVTNTIPITHPNPSNKIKILSIANIMGEAIIRIHEQLSVSKLFED